MCTTPVLTQSRFVDKSWVKRWRLQPRKTPCAVCQKNCRQESECRTQAERVVLHTSLKVLLQSAGRLIMPLKSKSGSITNRPPYWCFLCFRQHTGEIPGIVAGYILCTADISHVSTQLTALPVLKLACIPLSLGVNKEAWVVTWDVISLCWICLATSQRSCSASQPMADHQRRWICEAGSRHRPANFANELVFLLMLCSSSSAVMHSGLGLCRQHLIAGSYLCTRPLVITKYKTDRKKARKKTNLVCHVHSCRLSMAPGCLGRRSGQDCVSCVACYADTGLQPVPPFTAPAPHPPPLATSSVT